MKAGGGKKLEKKGVLETLKPRFLFFLGANKPQKNGAKKLFFLGDDESLPFFPNRGTVGVLDFKNLGLQYARTH